MTSGTVFVCVKNSAKNEGSKCSVGEQITPLNLKKIAEVRYQVYDFVIVCSAEGCFCFFSQLQEVTEVWGVCELITRHEKHHHDTIFY